MTTQSTVYPNPNVSTAPETSIDDSSASNSLGAIVPELRANLQQLVEAGKRRAAERRSGFRNGIREKPIQSVLIAASVGALVGLIVGRSNR